ncbi:hypothetical protein D1007_23437 [Hordeum vulgare]|nr:hypothetical protein D1007_23437 [Hordeum vulgare]
MDKVPTFSILSASSWARFSWQGRKLQDGGQGRAGQDGIGRQGGLPADKGKSQSPRFAPEFDGIDCFETIVCR